MSLAKTPIQWVLAQLKPNCAAIAVRHLERQGLQTFLPLGRHTEARGGRFVTSTRPYFAGYLFVGVGRDSAPWQAIRSTQGISRLVSFGSQPAMVPTALVEQLMQGCDSDGVIAEGPAMSAGDDVRVVQGPFASFIGKVVDLKPDQRAWVLLDVMGKQTRVSMSRGDLRVAG